MKKSIWVKVQDQAALDVLSEHFKVKLTEWSYKLFLSPSGIKVENKQIKKTQPKMTFLKPCPKLTLSKTTKLHWAGMPEHTYGEEPDFTQIEIVYDDKNYDYDYFSSLLDQPVTDSVVTYRYPTVDRDISSYRVVGGPRQGQFPIYVISKGRSDCCATSKFLTLMEVYHSVVVEPQEYDLYVERVQSEYATIIQLDMTYKENYDACDDLGNSIPKGSGGARNFCWDHSIKNGYAWHWLMDDNTTTGFFWRLNHFKYKVRTGAFFKALEDWVLRYENIGIAGLHYACFRVAGQAAPPYTPNTRIYSYLLIRNDIPFRWRGRYNEDTILSLDVLKAGWCTVQFNTFLAGKAATQTVKGGNTDDLYKPNGTLPKSEMLVRLHPDVSEVKWRFNRWHHIVDYSVFKNELKYKPEFEHLHGKDDLDNYGMVIINTEETENTDSRSYLEEKYLGKKNEA
ncbi:hypothetical protein Kuja_0330 [Vibrio phage vB_VchM_Kuja]|uniref:TET-Associated Glycosyltransferase domain-containing protein n=1 Tax=Vibrio phage vB_VchM_Kuja TaxID=2686437 RepID=A0A6B9J7M2_9CAUD|nr:beta-glucosyl-HMC-alpha-glucosyltransferase [Vibrio phage vB_VchM_Kuja]QGZ16024.1 hypothetical protein Kuja_0330 [Vibrio phage vB_VchM_Kuja]